MEICKHVHTCRIEVRYAETDQMGVVHHAVYPVWFEQARLEYFRSAGANYTDIEAAGFVSPVLKLEVQYKRPNGVPTREMPIQVSLLFPESSHS